MNDKCFFVTYFRRESFSIEINTFILRNEHPLVWMEKENADKTTVFLSSYQELTGKEIKYLSQQDSQMMFHDKSYGCKL